MHGAARERGPALLGGSRQWARWGACAPVPPRPDLVPSWPLGGRRRGGDRCGQDAAQEAAGVVGTKSPSLLLVIEMDMESGAVFDKTLACIFAQVSYHTIAFLDLLCILFLCLGNVVFLFAVTVAGRPAGSEASLSAVEVYLA